MWGHMIALKNHMSSSIFIKCINAIDLYFQYPPFFTGLIGYYALLTIDHWTDEQKNCLKDPNPIKDMQKEAEDIILLGWNEKNSDPSVGVGQLNTLTKTLDIMKRVSNSNTFQFEDIRDIKDTISTVCSVMENDWIKESLGLLKEAFQTHQLSPKLIKLYIDMSQNKFDSFGQCKEELNEVYWNRMNTFFQKFGKSFKINSGSMMTICMFIGVHNQLLPNLKEQLAWSMGMPAQQDGDQYGHMPVVSLLGLLQSTGNFVCRKQEQFRFNQVVKDLEVFAQSEEISHLLMMSLAAIGETTGSLQKHYSTLLVKKLSEDCEMYGAESGDHALCILRSLLTEYVGLMERFISYTFGPFEAESLPLQIEDELK